MRNPHCKELCAAWEKGGDCKLAMFAKFVASGERGLELECCMKLKKSKEVEENDKGKYKTWDKVLDHFQNDLDRARRFVACAVGKPRAPWLSFLAVGERALFAVHLRAGVVGSC